MKSALQTLIERGSPDEILENCGEYDLQTLIVPAGHKPLFKACAKILAELPDETFEPLAAESARCFISTSMRPFIRRKRQSLNSSSDSKPSPMNTSRPSFCTIFESTFE